MTVTTIGSWGGRALRVIHAPGSRTRWRMEVTSAQPSTYKFFRAWLGQEWPELTGYYYSLGLAESRPLAAAVARLIHDSHNGHAVQWLAELERVDPEMRLPYVEAVVPYAEFAPAAEVLRLVRTGPSYRDELTDVLAALRRGVPLNVVRQSLLYSQVTGYSLQWERASAVSRFDLGCAMDLLLQAGVERDRYLCKGLWRVMVRRADAASVFGASFWAGLDTATTYQFLSFAVDQLDKSNTNYVQLLPLLERLLRFYQALDANEKALARDLTNEYFRQLPEVWPVVSQLPTRLVPDDVPHYFLVDPYLKMPLAQRAAFAHAPEKSFDVVVKAMARRNDGLLLAAGLYSLCRALPLRTVELLNVAPKHLVRLARLVGGLHESHAAQILRPQARHELCTATVADGDVVCLDNLLTRHAARAKRLPRFHEWELHFSGTKLMPLHGVRQAFDELRGQIALLAAWHIEDAVKEHLAFDPHTYSVMRNSDQNRRLLRRFLREPHLDFIDSHPATRAWRQAHTAIDVERWRRGVAVERDGVRLAMERDHREVLKMGTYAGSCLGLGGHNLFNAATVLLDINKQVVFARDARGNFVARQLLAISAEGKLVCFPVYVADGTRDRWQPLFAEHARSLAWALGVSIHTTGPYAIPRVIARAWYDDGHWDLVAEADRVAA